MLITLFGCQLETTYICVLLVLTIKKLTVMTNKQMYKLITETAKSARKSGQTIEINYSLPYVDINGTEDVYFLQGEEASNLLEEAVNTGNKFSVSVEDAILWQSQSW
jgi:hypothetical protein